MARRQRSRTALVMVLAVGGLVALTTGCFTTAMAAESGARIAAAPAAAERESAQAPSELAREGLAKLLQAVNKLIEAVPQFEMPEMNENGDIILRRKRPEGTHPAMPAQAPEQAENQPI